MVTTVGQIIVNNEIPEEFRDHARNLTKGETDKLLEAIAVKYPERYRDISLRMMQVGKDASFDEGTTLRLSDLAPNIDIRPNVAALHLREAAIKRDKTMSPQDKQDALDSLYGEVHQDIQDRTMKAALAVNNPLALQVKSRARGTPGQLASMLSTPGVYQDSHDKTIPLFIEHSYAHGLAPHEYFAASYGARKGVISNKQGTRRAGYLGKLMGMAVMDSVVTEPDCETPYGIPVDAHDPDNLGAVLARDIAGFPAGTVVSSSVMSKLAGDKVDSVVLRSTITCGTHKGVCQQCAGQRESGDFPELGYHIGLNAASALAEQIAQQALNIKHSGKKSEGNVTYAGFDVIKNLATSPELFPDRAAIAEVDGDITAIRAAPQGGYHVDVGGQQHYVGANMALKVQEGDTVEAGDQLSDGIITPDDAVKYKGIGEGRLYFANRMTQAFRETNLGANRRNAEALARSIVNHVQITDPDAAGEHLPGDVVTYSDWAYGYRPRSTATRQAPRQSIGRYLEEPALHYTIGTKISKNVANALKQQNINDVLTHQDPVGVAPTMVSVVNTPQYSDDWMARLSSSYLKTRLLEDVHRAATSNPYGANPLPGLAQGIVYGDKSTKVKPKLESIQPS